MESRKEVLDKVEVASHFSFSLSLYISIHLYTYLYPYLFSQISIYLLYTEIDIEMSPSLSPTISYVTLNNSVVNYWYYYDVDFLVIKMLRVAGF